MFGSFFTNGVMEHNVSVDLHWRKSNEYLNLRDGSVLTRAFRFGNPRKVQLKLKELSRAYRDDFAKGTPLGGDNYITGGVVFLSWHLHYTTDA